MKVNFKIYKDLFFDLDNTLLDFDYASSMAFKSLLESHNLKSDKAYQVYRKVNKSIWEAFEKGEITAAELRAKRFDIFLEKMNWNGNGADWNQQYLDFLVTHIQFVPGAKQLLLEAVKEHRIHIVTNGLKEVQRPRIKLAGLNEISSSITVSDEIGVAKPQIEFFETAFANAKQPSKAKSLMIGDNYSSDIAGAYNFGMNSCWYNRLSEIKKDHLHTYEVKDLRNIKT